MSVRTGRYLLVVVVVVVVVLVLVVLVLVIGAAAGLGPAWIGATGRGRVARRAVKRRSSRQPGLHGRDRVLASLAGAAASRRTRRRVVAFVVLALLGAGARALVRAPTEPPADLAASLRGQARGLRPVGTPPGAPARGTIDVSSAAPASGSSPPASPPGTELLPTGRCERFAAYRDAYVAAHHLALVPEGADGSERRAYAGALERLHRAFPLHPAEIDTWHRVEMQWVAFVRRRATHPPAAPGTLFEDPTFVAAMRTIEDELPDDCRGGTLLPR